MTAELDARRAELLAESATLADTPDGQARHDEIMAELARLTYGDDSAAQETPARTELETRLIAQRDRAANAVKASAPNSTQEELDRMRYTARRLADYQTYGWLAY